jgi:ComF family protein
MSGLWKRRFLDLSRLSAEDKTGHPQIIRKNKEYQSHLGSHRLPYADYRKNHQKNKIRLLPRYPYRSQAFFEETLPQIPIPADAVLCPVPLHLFRKNERGFNQAKSIAEEFSRISKVPTQELLKRKRHTHPQTKLDGEKRRQNLLGAFCLRKKMDQKREKDSPIILVDDVTTTFSTLEECAKTLKKKGFTNISALVIARSI